MANKIQIKRSTSNATVTGLSNGELAFTQVSNTLYIGLPDGSGVLRIGGGQYPGILTPNQALVANSTSGINKIIVANAVITSVVANGSLGTNSQVLISNGTGTYWGTGIAGADTQVQFNDSGVANGSPGLTFFKTSNTLAVTGYITTTELLATTVNAATLSVGGWVVANTSGVFTSGVVNGDIIRVGSNFIANTSQVTIGSGVGFSANGSVGNANQVLSSNGTSVYWADIVGDISAVTAGNGLTGGGSSGDVTLSVQAGTGVSVNSTGVHIGQEVATTSNVTFANVITTDLTVNGSTRLGSAANDGLTIVSHVNSSIIPSSNQSYDLGTNTLRWANVYANDLHISSSATFGGNVSIDGNLTVVGNVTTTNVNSVVVSDPIIYLAGNNYTSDLVDIGFAANYNDGTNRHTGLFRDHTDGIYKLFYNLTQELSGNNDVDTSDPSYRTATLVAYLSSGALSTNTTSANLTANSTVSVEIVANTLTLSSALAGTSGGTGKSTVTNNALLVGNSTNGYNELTLGSTGYVLQSNGSALIYDILDGGSF